MRDELRLGDGGGEASADAATGVDYDWEKVRRSAATPRACAPAGAAR